jgi:hypothetical protein
MLRLMMERKKLRTAASVFMLAVGAFASLATSPPTDDLSDVGEGERFVLDVDHPVARASLGFHETEAVRDGEVSVLLETDELWVDVAKRRLLQIAIVSANGDPTPSPWAYVPDRRAYECRGAACSGDWDITFGLPEGFREGSVRVDWRATARAFFNGDVPHGAEIDVGVGSISGGAGPAEVADTGMLEAPRNMPVVVQHFDISIPDGLGARRTLSFGRAAEVGLPDADIVTSVVALQPGLRGRQLEPGAGVELRPADACRRGPCHIDFSVVVSVRPPGSYGQWGSVALGWVLDAAPPIDGLRTTSEIEPVPAISAGQRLTHLAVHGFGDQASTRATISISSASISTAVVFAQVTLTDYVSDWPSPSADSAQVELVEADTVGAEPWRGTGQPDPAAGLAPPGAVLTPRCNGTATCTVDISLILGIGAESNAPDRSVEATPILRVFLLYPLGVPPDHAKVAIEAA